MISKPDFEIAELPSNMISSLYIMLLERIKQATPRDIATCRNPRPIADTIEMLHMLIV